MSNLSNIGFSVETEEDLLKLTEKIWKMKSRFSILLSPYLITST